MIIGVLSFAIFGVALAYVQLMLAMAIGKKEVEKKVLDTMNRPSFVIILWTIMAFFFSRFTCQMRRRVEDAHC